MAIYEVIKNHQVVAVLEQPNAVLIHNFIREANNCAQDTSQLLSFRLSD